MTHTHSKGTGMRRVAEGQNFFRYPLNELLGTEAHVRVLRVLATEVAGPVGMSDLARRAGLTLPGLLKAIGRLVDSGILVSVGGGRPQYAIRESEPLAKSILALFEAEKKRYETFLRILRRQIENLPRPPFAAWVQKVPQKPGNQLEIGILHDSRHLNACLIGLRTKLIFLEKEYDLTIELNGYSRGESPKFYENESTLLFGVLPNIKPLQAYRTTSGASHQAREKHAIALSLALAKIVESDPSLVRRAKDHLESVLEEDQGMANKDLLEWKEVLKSYSIQRLLRFLVSHSERAMRLRQSNPFFAVLNAAEKEKIAIDVAESQ